MFLSCFSENLICAPRKIISLHPEVKERRLIKPLEAIAEIDLAAYKVPLPSDLGPLSSEEDSKKICTETIQSEYEVKESLESTQKEATPELVKRPANGTARSKKGAENKAFDNPNFQQNPKVSPKPSPKQSPVPPKRSMLPIIKSQLPTQNKQKVAASRIPLPSSRKITPPGKLLNN